MRSSDAAKLARILGLLGSDQAGERAAAAEAAHRLVTRLGLSWDEVLAPQRESSQADSALRRKPASASHDTLAAAQSRLRQSMRENADLRRRITQLQRRIEVLHQQMPAPAPEED
ncbi:hypothetical protein JMJ56_22230 [Belnapia sp. T18]|uniref:Uncharacterized protein n=1 Tax=Belnapia arida TaxID=2804533 RepID=A0ABS1U7T7_9PROT|nr:hypothetical protein [Belnapia arida]MBL6080738.1 hypothetical protein [Belnapia arida]